MGVFIEPLSEAPYAWVDLRVWDPLRRMCQVLAAGLHKHVQVPKWAHRKCFHSSFGTWALGA